jgi:hypothetical protein
MLDLTFAKKQQQTQIARLVTFAWVDVFTVALQINQLSNQSANHQRLYGF